MTNKLKYFIGNWKMFGDFTSFKIVSKLNEFKYRSKDVYKTKIVLCVPNTLIYFFKKNLKSKHLSLGAQNCNEYEKEGPYTGSVSSAMIKKAGAEYIILGHSENRSEGETNFLIKKKIKSSLQQKMNIIFCIGESLSDKRNGKTFSVLKKQIGQSIDIKFELNKIIFAYEPVWAIGTNRIPQKIELENTINFLKSFIKKKFKIKKNPKILYGGSVNPKNISQFSSIPQIDGFLIGGASQSSKKFIDIVKNYYK